MTARERAQRALTQWAVKHVTGPGWSQQTGAFTALTDHVAAAIAAERERAAQIVDRYRDVGEIGGAALCDAIAAAIREGGGS